MPTSIIPYIGHIIEENKIFRVKNWKMTKNCSRAMGVPQDSVAKVPDGLRIIAVYHTCLYCMRMTLYSFRILEKQ